MIAAEDRRRVKVLGVRKYHSAAPVLFAALGITLGTLTGLAVAILGTPAGANGIPAVLANADSTGPGHDTAYGPTQQAHLTAPALVADAVKSATDASHQLANEAATGTPRTMLVVDAPRSTGPQLIPAKAPSVGKTPTPWTVYKAHHSAGWTVTHPFMTPALIVTTNDSLASQPLLIEADEPLNLKDQAKPSNFYIEGDFKVVDYDATAGTIETSDGRTFVVGTTVAASNATPWGEYRSNLHYRCSQTGSCALSRAGAVAPNARLI